LEFDVDVNFIFSDASIIPDEDDNFIDEPEDISSGSENEVDVDDPGDAPMEYEEEEVIPEHRRMSWRQLLKKFNTHPGCRVSNDAWTSFLRDVQKHKPTLNNKDLKQLPKTGRGLTYLKKKYYDHIVFRDLLEYEPDDDEFAYSNFSQDFDRWHHEEIVPEPLLEFEDKDEEETVENAHDDEEIMDDDGGTTCNDVQTEDDADDECSEKDIDEIEGFLLEKDVQIDMEKCDENEDGWLDQGMCYFGIENVLMGRNPGILDVRGYENVLKAIATLKPDSLSDEIVNKLWDDKKHISKESHQTNVSLKPPTTRKD
jgi:hypothetical protein